MSAAISQCGLDLSSEVGSRGSRVGSKGEGGSGDISISAGALYADKTEYVKMW